MSVCICVCLPLSISPGTHGCGSRAAAKDTQLRMQQAAGSSPSLTLIGADTDKHLHPILGLRYTCCLAKVKNKAFRARLWSVFQFSCAPQCEGEGGELRVLHHSHQGQPELLREHSRSHPEHVVGWKKSFSSEK